MDTYDILIVDDHPVVGMAMQVMLYQCLETPPPTADLSLTAAVSLALCHHPQIRNTRAAIALQAAQLGQARAAYG